MKKSKMFVWLPLVVALALSACSQDKNDSNNPFAPNTDPEPQTHAMPKDTVWVGPHHTAIGHPETLRKLGIWGVWTDGALKTYTFGVIAGDIYLDNGRGQFSPMNPVNRSRVVLISTAPLNNSRQAADGITMEWRLSLAPKDVDFSRFTSNTTRDTVWVGPHHTAIGHPETLRKLGIWGVWTDGALKTYTFGVIAGDIYLDNGRGQFSPMNPVNRSRVVLISTAPLNNSRQAADGITMEWRL